MDPPLPTRYDLSMVKFMTILCHVLQWIKFTSQRHSQNVGLDFVITLF